MLVMTATAFAATTSEKLLDDDYAPNGSVVPAKAITVDWATQKLVVNVNLANCSDTPNECIFSVSTNATDIANWDQESGSTLHLFYTKNARVWTATGWETYTQKFAVQYRYAGDSGATNHYFVVSDPSNCTIVMDKDGIKMDGTLVFPASEMSNLYKEGANQLYFGSVRAEHTYATYKSVELVTEGPAVEPVSYEFTHNADVCYYEKTGESGEDSQYNVYHQYIKDAKVMLENDKTGKYTATLKDVVAGKEKSALGDIVLAGLENEADGSLEFKLPTTLSFTVDVATSPFYGKTFTVVSGTIEATPAADAASKGVANVAISFADADGNMLTYMFNADVFIPVVQNFESDAYVKVGEETTNLEKAQAVLTEFMEDTYMVTFKNLTLGEKTGDFTIENLKPTKGEDGKVTFSTEDTSGFWNDADETELNFTDFSASAKVGENGFEGFVCKFTTENGQFVYGEKAETPDPPSVVETKIFSDKLNYTFRGTIGTNDPQKLTIESLGNDRYNVILANLNSVNVLSVNVGTISFKNVAGKTENGITTIEVANPEVTFTDTDQELVDSKKGNLKVMFNNDKAYLNASGAVKIVSFGMSFDYTLVYGTEFSTEEPKDDYAINFDKDALNTSAHGRMLNSFSLQQAGKETQTKSVKTSKAAYEDHTADEPFTVEAGSELTASFDYTGEWMHSFVYIDFDNDGDFSYKEGQWDQTGTDLVAFSFYSLDSNPKNDASGYNSVGDELTGDARNTYAAPSFKAPAKAGEYRIRFKLDWNCILPGGSSTILEDGGGVWDATLKVVEPVVDGISTINVEAANGEAQLFTIDGVKLSKLQKGLNIVRTADGKVKKVLVK